MKTRMIFSLMLLIVISSICSEVKAQYYAQTVTTYSWDNSPATNVSTTSADDAAFALTIPFSFNFFGTAYTTCYVSTNGLMTFGTTSTAWTNQCLPNTAAPNNLIAAYWDDLYFDWSCSPTYWRYGTIGTTPNRTFIVSWIAFITNGGSCGTYVYSQIKLFETSNIIEVHLQSNAVGTGGSIGIENTDGTVGYQAICNSATTNGTAWRWTPCITPGTPTAPSGAATGTTTANISWTAGSPAGSPTITYYWNLYNLSGTLITSGNTTGTSATITGLICGTSYYFTVYAYTSCGGTSSSVATSGNFNTYACEMTVPTSGNNTYNVCNGHLYDNGGSSGDYADNNSGYTVITPTAGNFAQISGNITCERGYDYLTIYDGVGTSGNILWGGSPYGNGTSCGTFTVPTVTSTTGPLTIKFYSDGSNVCSGFDLTINCANVNPCANINLPYTEGFNGTSIPYCWSQQQVIGTSVFQFVEETENPETEPWEGTNYVSWNSYSISSGNETRLVSPPIITTGTSNVSIRFFWMNENSSSYNSGDYLFEGVQVQYSLDKANWIDVDNFIPRQDATLASGTSQWTIKEIPLPISAGNQPTIYVGFKFHSSFGDNCSMDGFWIGEQYTDPMPVSLLSFDGKCNEGKVELRWETATETNNDYFTLEKSEDAFNWSFYKRISGAGNSNQLINYLVTDEILSKTTYYRLTQTDYDGKKTYFEPIHISPCSQSASINPNPTTDFLNIKTSAENISYEIFDSYGNLVLSGYEKKIDIKNLATSMYLIRIYDTSGIIYSGKLIKK